MRLKLIVGLLCIICFKINAQTQSLSSAQLLQQIQKLNVVGSVLYIAAHPDDENTRLLGYLANHKKVKTTYLSLTRGDGGQNLIGKEQGIGLGLIRTNELLAARATDGAEQLFTRAYDFGYSKNPEETFEMWNKDSVLSDVVLAIRKLKPDVIICRFPITGEGGHGHHTASGILAQEAFDAAADATKFTYQLKNHSVWQAKRLYWNAFVPSDAKEINPKHLKLDVGVFNPLLGKSYGELAAESRSCHKSQGFGSAALRGKHVEYFEYYKGDSAINDLFENVNWSWSRFGLSSLFEKQINSIISKFNPIEPYKSVKDIIKLYTSIQQSKSSDAIYNFYKAEKLKELQKIILEACGVWLETNAAEYDVIAGENMNLNIQALTRYADVPVTVKRIYSNMDFDTITQYNLLPNQLFTIKKKLILSKSATSSNPYWLDKPIANNLFVVENSNLIGLPKKESDLEIIYEVSIMGVDFNVAKAVVNKFTDPVRGEVYRPIEVLPKVTIQLVEPVIMFVNQQTKFVKAIIKNHSQQAIEGDLTVPGVSGWEVNIKEPHFKISKKDEEQVIVIEVKPKAIATKETLQLQAVIENTTFNKSKLSINYEHIPNQFILSTVSLKLVPVDVKIKGNKIGYIPGAGDDVAACLQQIGYEVIQLSDDDISTKNLSSYDAIITGVRAYNTNANLVSMHQKLMAYIQQGGNMIVQYNTNSRAGPLKDKIGPYPFTISRDRVTDERASIIALQPNHEALNTPNKITDADYENWIQERGIYFATEVDSHYVKVLSMNDKGDKPADGSLIITPYGKGNFVYTGIVFFRELPAGVPGAYRLLSNLISLPKHD
jgi:LmbE family N-acetylglucosaminyl deacetylase